MLLPANVGNKFAVNWKRWGLDRYVCVNLDLPQSCRKRQVGRSHWKRKGSTGVQLSPVHCLPPCSLFPPFFFISQLTFFYSKGWSTVIYTNLSLPQDTDDLLTTYHRVQHSLVSQLIQVTSLPNSSQAGFQVPRPILNESPTFVSSNFTWWLAKPFITCQKQTHMWANDEIRPYSKSCRKDKGCHWLWDYD